MSNTRADIIFQPSNNGPNEMCKLILSHDDHDDQQGSTLNNDRAKEIYTLAKTDAGVTYLRNVVCVANQEEFGNFVSNVMVSIHILMTHNYGHRLVRDVLRRCDFVQINKVVDFVCRDKDRLKTICLNDHGCEAMKILISQYLMTGAKLTSVHASDIILEALRPITMDLTQSHIGCQIIETCVKLFLPKDTKYIASEIASHCPDLTMDHVGCHVVQTCLENDNEYRGYILNYVAHNALMLSQHNYGNYVVQRALELRSLTATSIIMAQLENNFVTLSMNKFGSNVVETCLEECHPFHVGQIIVELVVDVDFLEFLQDQYGNYVAQSALKRSKAITGGLNSFLVVAIERYSRSLQNHMYGSKVLAMATNKKGHQGYGSNENWGRK